MMVVLLAACVLWMCLGSTFGIKCYIGLQSNYKLFECASSETHCVKATVNGAQVARSCHPPASTISDGCQTYNGGEVCICSTDACNGAATSYVSKMLAVILTVITALVVM